MGLVIIMWDDGTNISSQDAEVSIAPSGSFSHNAKQVTAEVSVLANHNEIVINENTWEDIVSKLRKIRFRPQINWQEILLGAAIPYAISAFQDFSANRSPNFFPLFVCLILFILGRFLIKVIKAFGFDRIADALSDNTTAENQVRLDDLLDLIERIDSKR